MIELSGLKVGEDIQIEYTGLRPGERLSENLFADHEHPPRTEHDKIFVSRNGLSPLPAGFPDQIETLIQLALAGKTEPTLALLRRLALDAPLTPQIWGAGGVGPGGKTTPSDLP